MAAVEILRWQILGIVLQVASWPMGFILQAKGRGKLFFMTNFLMNGVHVSLIWVGISYFGLSGTGMAFLGMWAFYWIMINGVAKRLTGFAWSGANVRIALLILPAIGIISVSGLFLDHFWCLILGSTISAAAALYSIKRLVGIISPDAFVPFLVKIKDRFWSGIS
jgi:PST family polysaccharide transporter